MVPLILQFVIGLCPVSSYNLLCIRLVDLSPASPATVTSANNLMRCLFRAGGAAIIIQKIKAMGRGWCITFIAAVLVLTSPMLWVEVKWDPRWRGGERGVRLGVKSAKSAKSAKNAKNANEWGTKCSTIQSPDVGRCTLHHGYKSNPASTFHFAYLTPTSIFKSQGPRGSRLMKRIINSSSKRVS